MHKSRLATSLVIIAVICTLFTSLSLSAFADTSHPYTVAHTASGSWKARYSIVVTNKKAITKVSNPQVDVFLGTISHISLSKVSPQKACLSFIRHVGILQYKTTLIAQIQNGKLRIVATNFAK